MKKTCTGCEYYDTLIDTSICSHPKRKKIIIVLNGEIKRPSDCPYGPAVVIKKRKLFFSWN